MVSKFHHARIQEFSPGWGPADSLTKKALTRVFFFFFFFFFFLVLSLFYRSQMVNFKEFKVPEGVQHFPGGPTFSRGGGGPIAYSL